MSNPIAEAFVTVRPDMAQFGPQLQAGLASAIGGLQLPTNVQNQLGQQLFGPNFQQQIQTQTTQSLKNTKVPVANQRSLAQQLFGPGFRDESGRAIQGIMSGLGAGGLAAQFSFFGAGGAGLAAIGAGFVVATDRAADFDRALNVLQATTGATDDELQEAAEAARRLGRDLELPGVNATDATNAILELAKAGLTMEDAIAGVEGTLRLAVAAGVDTGTASQIAASGLNAFSLAGGEASHVADLLAGASIAAQGDIGDMALALRQSAAVADQAGLSIEQLVGLITELARQGILGSDAGTAIRTMLLRLVPTTKEAALFMDALGIRLDETRTIGEQLPEVLDQYNRALGRLNPLLRQNALTQIFGTDAIRSATVAIEEGSAGLARAQSAADQEGAAARLAGAEAEGAAGAIRELGDAGGSLAITFGELTLPAVESLTRGLTDLVRGVDLGIGAIGELVSSDLGRLDQLFGTQDEERPRRVANSVREIGAEIATAREQLERFGGDFQRVLDLEPRLPIEAQIIGLVDELRNELEPAIRQGNLRIEEARALLDSLELPPELRTQFFDIVPPDLSEQFVRGVGGLQATAEREGRAVGNSFGDGVAEGITESEQLAIDAARRSLADIRRAGEEQILASITAARGNLESLGESLGSSIEDIIDVGPIADKIAEIDEELLKLQDTVTRRQLRFDFRDARRDLDEAKDAIVQVGELTPAQRAAQQEFLEPFQEKVKDAKAALKEFDLEEHKEQLEESLEQQKKTANEGVQVLIDKFEEGKITVGEFDSLLSNQLQPHLATLEANSENLGFVFTRDFKRDMETLVTQAQALSGFTGRPGTTPGTQVERPAQTVADVGRQIAEADRRLQQTIKDAQAKNTTENGQLASLLKQIRDAVGGRPTKQAPERPR